MPTLCAEALKGVDLSPICDANGKVVPEDQDFARG